MSFLDRAFARETRAVTSLSSIPKWSEVSAAGSECEPVSSPMRLATVFSCVRLLASSVASLPIRSYRSTGDVRVAVDPQPKLMQSPYPGMTWHNWTWMLMQSLSTTGNGFGRVTAWDTNGQPLAILPLSPNAVTVDPNKGTWDAPHYLVNGKHVPSNEIFHVKAYPTAGNAMALSPIEMAATTIDLAHAADRYGLRWFRDSANPSGILSSDQDLTAEQIKRTQFGWIKAHRERRGPAVLGGGFKYTPVSITPEESQFLETRQYQKSDISMLFGIPPHMIGDTQKATSWGAGIESQSIGFVVYTLMPWLVCIEQAFDQILPRGQFSKFNADALLRGDLKSRYEAHAIAWQNGWISDNEIRALEERQPIAEGDTHYRPANFVPLGYMPPEPSATKPPAAPASKKES